MDNPLISVVVTTYRRNEETLSRAINSICSQTYPSIEIIVVDDNGKDSSYQNIVRETVGKFKDKRKIKLIQHELNSGAQVARNSGITNSKGEYVSFLDDDDVWLSHKLESQMNLFKKSNNINLGLVYCWFYKYEQQSNGDYVKKIRKPQVKSKNIQKELLYHNFIGSTSFPLIKKQCFNEVGNFDETLVAKQDYDMWIRINKKFDIECVEDPLCIYYDHNEDRITNNIEKKIYSELSFLDKYFDVINNDKKALNIRYRLISKYFYKAKDSKKALEYVKLSLKAQPYNIKSILTFLFIKLGFSPDIL